VGIFLSHQGVLAQTLDAVSVRTGDAALTFASGAIQKTTPRDGIVNLVTGDNQATGNRMLMGKRDVFYLKLDNPNDVAVGDLFTVYRRVRKVFHPVTREYLGFVTIRSAVVKVVEVDRTLTTVETIVSYSSVSPGDLVMRYVAPAASENISETSDVADLKGMIVELQADRPMTLVSQANVVYVDRGREDGLKAGDLMDIYRHSAVLPARKIGQLKVLSTEDRTATARIMKASTRVMKGDRYKLAGYAAPAVQPAEVTPASQASPTKTEQAATVPTDLVASKLKVQDASGQSRINLGELANFLRYDSGEAAIKPEGYQVLDQLIEHLQTSGDSRLIRVEGHTDNVEIGPSLKSRYPNNWELSKARANGVVRYLVEKGGLDSARLSAVGYGDSRPAATNGIEEGRTKNRRVELLLYAPETEPQASKPGVSRLTQSPESDASSLSARGDENQPAGRTASPNEPGAPGSSDPVSMGERSQAPQAPTGEGTATPSSSDVGGSVSSDTGRQDTQPTAGSSSQ
jgi:chemotaxis protein MotB